MGVWILGPAELTFPMIDNAKAETAHRRLNFALPAAMSRRAGATHELLQRAHETGSEPWPPMYVDGHGPHWLATTKFIASHQRNWQKAAAYSSTH